MKRDPRYQTVKDLLRLCQEDVFQDVILRCSDGTLRQSSFLLSFFFPYLKEIFKETLFDEKINVSIPDYSVNDFKDFFNSIFLQKLEIKSSILFLVDQIFFSEEDNLGESISRDEEFNYSHEELLELKDDKEKNELISIKEDKEEKPVQISFRKKMDTVNVKSHQKIERYKGVVNETQKVRQQCTYCGKMVNDIKRHISYVCRKRDYGYGKIKCDLCEKTFNNPYNLKGHVRTTHAKKESEKAICNICGKVLLSKYILSIHHKNMHEIVELKYKCEKCGRMCESKGKLNKHMQTHFIQKTPCTICGKSFSNVERHMKTIHGKDEDKRVQCQDCGKGFQSQSHLKMHQMSVHLKLRPYSCRYGCEFRYNDSSNRNSHERKIHGKIFTTKMEEKLKEKIEYLGINTNQINTPFK